MSSTNRPKVFIFEATEQNETGNCQERVQNSSVKCIPKALLLIEQRETDCFNRQRLTVSLIKPACVCVVLLYLSRKQSPLLPARNNVTQ